MSNLSGGGIPPQPYGEGGRKVVLPVKANAQIYEGAMVAQISGACCTANTANAGNVVGVAEHDALGGSADGSVRISVLTDRVFVFKAGTAAPTDATPYGAQLFAEDDNSVGTGGLGANEQEAGRFVGFEDDGRVRVYFGIWPNQVGENQNDRAIGTALTDTASTTVQRSGRFTTFLLAGTMSQDESITFGTTGAVKGDIIKLIRTSTSAHTTAIVNGGAGAGTLCTLVASKVGWAQAWFDGANWLYDGCSAV